MTALIVKSCGPATSIQDRGRFFYQRYGVSPAGAIDPLSLAASNVLVGAAPDAAAIELGLGGARFTAQGAVTVALAGPACSLTIDGQKMPPFTAARASEGAEIVVRLEPGAAYAYLALQGGLATPEDMGSRSMHRRSGLGGPALAPGTVLPAQGDAPELVALAEPPRHEPGPIRLLPGPQDDLFPESALETLCGPGYRLSAQADRMGVRLEGPIISHRDGYNIVSDGIVDGAIQVPGDGQPIVLLRDRQTTGGYPKIATIISADIGRFAQIPPGAPVSFRIVTLDEAILAARQLKAQIDRLAGSCRPLAAPLTSERLLGLNLIGGVTSAQPAE